jgi:hypothetical protein
MITRWLTREFKQLWWDITDLAALLAFLTLLFLVEWLI